MKVIGDVISCGSETDDLRPINVKLMNLMITEAEAQSIADGDQATIDTLVLMIKATLTPS